MIIGINLFKFTPSPIPSPYQLGEETINTTKTNKIKEKNTQTWYSWY